MVKHNDRRRVRCLVACSILVGAFSGACGTTEPNAPGAAPGPDAHAEAAPPGPDAHAEAAPPGPDAHAEAATAQPDGGADAALMTEEQWAALTAPVGPHSIVSLSCAAEPIAQDYLIEPTVSCSIAPDYGPDNRVRSCTVEMPCTSSAQCVDRPFGVCRGAPSAWCEYPRRPAEPCGADGDCSTFPGGTCPRIPLSDTLCYPTGRCDTPHAVCAYPEPYIQPMKPCGSDADCTAAADGHCIRRTLFVRCTYNACLVDADCGPAKRCSCRSDGSKTCVPADCLADGDCGAGQVCRVQSGCYSIESYHCSTNLDSCVRDADCGVGIGAWCALSGGLWQCVARECPSIP